MGCNIDKAREGGAGAPLGIAAFRSLRQRAESFSESPDISRASPQMLIKGIRSFSPDNQNVIEFYRPLTLIVGHNGAGKTVIGHV